MNEKTSPTPFGIKRDLKGNLQLAGYGNLTVMATFHPAGFPSDQEMEDTAALVVRACNSHEALVAALKDAHIVLAMQDRSEAWKGEKARCIDRAAETLKLVGAA